MAAVILEQEWDTDKTLTIRAEQALWRAVITQALMDASSKSKKMEAKYEKSQALCWLTGYGEDFKTVCDLAGFNPDYVRENSIDALQRDCRWRAQNGFADASEKSEHRAAPQTPYYSCAWRDHGVAAQHLPQGV